MKTKTIITIGLLLFVCVSVAYLVAKEVRPLFQSSQSQTKPQAVADKAEAAVQDAGPRETATELSEKVVVYYFHGTARCTTCRKFEAFTDEIIHRDFAAELADGRLQWQVINVDQPGNEHFIKDYQLYSKSVVVTKVRDGQQLKWKNLDKIWELVRDKGAFTNYIQNEVRQYLEMQE